MAALIIDNSSIVLRNRWSTRERKILGASMLETALVALVRRFLITAGISGTCRYFLLSIVTCVADFEAVVSVIVRLFAVQIHAYTRIGIVLGAIRFPHMWPLFVPIFS